MRRPPTLDPSEAGAPERDEPGGRRMLLRFVDRAGHVLRDVTMDQAVLPLPYQRAVQQLPFAAPEVWQVGQEPDSDYSHRGYASFCWDFTHVPDHVVAQAALAGSGRSITRANPRPINASSPR